MLKDWNTHITSLHEIPGDEEMLPVGSDLDVVRPDDGLVLVGIVQALDVAEIRDVQGRDVVAQREGEVGELPVLRDVRVDGHRVLGLVAKVKQLLGHALLAVGVETERVDDPDLAEANGTCSVLVRERRNEN